MRYNLNEKQLRAKSNLDNLYTAARKLEELNEQVVYVGGCIVGLLVTDPVALAARPTFDVDCIIDIISLNSYYQLSQQLRAKGFVDGRDILCRWCSGDTTIDIMPVDEKILNFGNRWYREALTYAQEHHAPDGLILKLITAPYFLATKIEAFKSRGNHDYWGSHDLEDIITVIAGRAEIVAEMVSSRHDLRVYIRQFFEEALSNEQFHLALPGHVSDGSITYQRVEMVKSRVNEMMATQESLT